MKPYSEYKPTNVGWIENIPSHWDLKKMKYLAEVNPSKGASEVDRETEELAVFLPMEKVSENGHVDTSIKKPVSQLYSGFTYFEKGDIIVAKITPCFENGKGAILDQLDTKLGFGSTEFHVLRAKKGISSRYLYYLTRSDFFKAVGEAFMVGSAGQKRVPTSFVENFPIPIPEDYHEQDHIARFLDHKTHQIDTAIAKLERLIELLKEERAAVINEAVTKGLRGDAARHAGLDPDPPMKDSGVEWIGEVPAHWETVKLKFLAEINPQKGNAGLDKESDDRVVFLPMENISETGDVNQSVKKPISEVYSGYTYFAKDDVLIAKITPCFENGKGAILDQLETGIGFGSTEFHVLRAKEEFVNKYFLYYLTRTDLFFTLGEAFMVGAAGQKRVPTSFVEDFELGIPLNKKEQIAIVDLIANKIDRVERDVFSIKREIALLREYRQSLISEAVTGKIDVRNYPILEDEEKNVNVVNIK